MLLHQIIPHLHHDYAETHEHASLDHNQDHDHEKDSETSQDLFSFLLGMHSHGGSNSEVPVVKISIEQVAPKKVNAEKQLFEFYSTQTALFEENLVDLFENYQPPSRYFNPYLSQLSLRGPPYLV
ncbi:MAG TPA: hypothetical protein VIM94_04660 [Salegentibacter sp.]|uniref:hypothetical protein n=1 Tax=Salegentibacter sp. TaxID=1903072 RepID=UPI002F94192D